ncbi:MAG TPA: hypothetical protein VGD62_12780, partial [Acidobacteriaceae bacterium]
MFCKPWRRLAASTCLLVAGWAAARPAPAEAPALLSTTLPDAPLAPAAAQAGTAPQTTPPAQPAPAPPPPPPAQTSPAPPASTQDTYNLKKAEHQRILGIMPEFQAVNTGGVVQPLRPGEKFNLMWKSSTDPFIFTLDAIVAGIGQAKNSNPGFGQGTKGYLKRFGSSYADTFDGNFWGNAVLTVALKEDPRY